MDKRLDASPTSIRVPGIADRSSVFAAQTGCTGLSQQSAGRRPFLALEEGRVVGCLSAQCKPETVYVGKFAVSPDRQKQGVGRRLMEAAGDFARSVGRHVLELETRIELIENHETFTALGFVKVAEHAHRGYDRPTYISTRKMLPPTPAPVA